MIKKTEWTKEMDDFLLKYRGKMKDEEIGKYLGVKRESLRWRCFKLRLKGYQVFKYPKINLKDLRVKLLYGKVPTHHLAESLGVKPDSIRLAAKKTAKPFHALINLDDLKAFLRKRPEALNLEKIGQLEKHLLELNNIKVSFSQKLVLCKKCQKKFRADIYENFPRCPSCRCIASKWALAYFK